MNVWKVIPNHEEPSRAFDLFCERGVIAVGWTDVGDLRNRLPQASRDITGWIQEAYPQLDNSHLGGPSLWNFFSLMKPGDLVLVSSKGRRLGVVSIIGDYEFCAPADAILGYRHIRRAAATDQDPHELWRSCGRKVAQGDNGMWTVARLQARSAQSGSRTGDLGESDVSLSPDARYWLNVDLPNKTQVLHIVNACADVRRKGSFTLKQVGRINRVGGWLPFPSISEAELNAASRVVHGLKRLSHCPRCSNAYPEFRLSGDPVTDIGQAVTPLARNRSATDPDADIPDPAEDPELLALMGNQSLTATEKEALVKLRIGQGVFRVRLLKKWGGCSVSGCREESVLIASHILPWRLCQTKQDRISCDNGLLLTPNLDKLFDRGMISFDERGGILISKSLGFDIERAFGIDPGLRLRSFVGAGMQPYLERHRREIFQGPAKPRAGEPSRAGP